MTGRVATFFNTAGHSRLERSRMTAQYVDEEGFAALVDSARDLVVVDFTAEWCITCKFLKRTVLDREPLRSRLQQSDVYLVEVDLSAKTAPGWTYLRSLGRTAVPTLAVFGPAQGDPVILNAYTQDTVLNAIKAVSGTATIGAAGPHP